MAETKEERGGRPPSYTEPSPAAPGAAPAYTGPVAPQQAVFMPQGGVVPQQGYVIQNVPVPSETGCCGGRSDKFKHRAGVATGIIHLVAAFVSIALSVCTFVLIHDIDELGYYYGMGGALGVAVIFFIPAGILGVLTKYKNSCVIVGYLVMTILSAIHALCVVGVEIPAAIFYSSMYSCVPYQDYRDFIPDHHFDVSADFVPDTFFERSSSFCGEHLYVSVLVIHISLAVVAFIEFISAIVGAAYCCGGLRCCCGQAPQQQSVMYYTPVGQPQAAPGTGQVEVQVTPDAAAEADALPQKA